MFALHAGQALLGGNGRAVEDRVLVVELGDDLRRIGCARRIG
jgi:hypothetical protein